jgi:hypothetical protein
MDPDLLCCHASIQPFPVGIPSPMCQSMHIAPASQVTGVSSDVRDVVSIDVDAPCPSKCSLGDCGLETLPRNLTFCCLVCADPRTSSATGAIDLNVACGVRNPHKSGL